MENPFGKIPPNRPDQNLVRRLSRTVLHTAKRKRMSLFDKMTTQNAERVAQLVQQETDFTTHDEHAKTSLDIDPKVEKYLPSEFFKDPTAWIESQPILERRDLPMITTYDPQVQTIESLWRLPYDRTRVRVVTLSRTNNQPLSIISKRVSTTDGLEEITRSRQAWETGIPTPKLLGEIHHRGNTYAWFEKLDRTLNMNEVLHSPPYNKIYGIPWRLTDPPEFPPQIPQSLQQKLIAHWKTHLSFFHELVLLDILKTGFTLEDPKAFDDPFQIPWSKGRNANTKIDLYERICKNKMISAEIQRSVLAPLGVVSIQELRDAIHDPDRITDIRLRCSQELTSIARHLEQTYNAVWNEIIEKTLFGESLRIIQDRLDKLCFEKGVPHKDLNLRNILVSWDARRNRPRIEKDGKAKFYLIDWEPSPKTPKQG